jgi:hypothetical protein
VTPANRSGFLPGGFAPINFSAASCTLRRGLLRINSQIHMHYWERSMSLRAGLIATAAVACLPLWSAPLALAGSPELKLPSFEHLQRLATDSVNVTIGQGLLGIASWALGQSADAKDHDAQEVLQGLKSIYIRSFKFAADHQYSSSDIEAIRSQLSAPGWNALAQIHQRGEGENVDIYVSTDHEVVNGLAIIASSPRELTIVNVVGSIDPAKLAKLSGRLGVPALPM